MPSLEFPWSTDAKVTFDEEGLRPDNAGHGLHRIRDSARSRKVPKLRLSGPDATTVAFVRGSRTSTDRIHCTATFTAGEEAGTLVDGWVLVDAPKREIEKIPGIKAVLGAIEGRGPIRLAATAEGLLMAVGLDRLGFPWHKERKGLILLRPLEGRWTWRPQTTDAAPPDLEARGLATILSESLLHESSPVLGRLPRDVWVPGSRRGGTWMDVASAGEAGAALWTIGARGDLTIPIVRAGVDWDVQQVLDTMDAEEVEAWRESLRDVTELGGVGLSVHRLTCVRLSKEATTLRFEQSRTAPQEVARDGTTLTLTWEPANATSTVDQCLHAEPSVAWVGGTVPLHPVPHLPPPDSESARDEELGDADGVAASIAPPEQDLWIRTLRGWLQVSANPALPEVRADPELYAVGANQAPPEAPPTMGPVLRSWGRTAVEGTSADISHWLGTRAEGQIDVHLLPESTNELRFEIDLEADAQPMVRRVRVAAVGPALTAVSRTPVSDVEGEALDHSATGPAVFDRAVGQAGAMTPPYDPDGSEGAPVLLVPPEFVMRWAGREPIVELGFKMEGRGRPSLEITSNHTTCLHWRPVPQVPLDTPMTWSANDPHAGDALSTIRPLLPLRLGVGTYRIEPRGCAWKVDERTSEPHLHPVRVEGRPLPSVRGPSPRIQHGHLDLEVAVGPNDEKKRVLGVQRRHAVAALDAWYREVGGGLREAEGGLRQAPLASTYVIDRMREKFVGRPVHEVAGEPSKAPVKPRPLTEPSAQLGPVVSWSVRAPGPNGDVLGTLLIQLQATDATDAAEFPIPDAVIERFAFVNRAGSGAALLGGLRCEAAGLRSLGADRLALTVDCTLPGSPDGGGVDTVVGRIQLTLAKRRRGVDRILESDASIEGTLLLPWEDVVLSATNVKSRIRLLACSALSLVANERLLKFEAVIWHGVRPGLFQLPENATGHMELGQTQQTPVVRLDPVEKPNDEALGVVVDPDGAITEAWFDHILPGVRIREHLAHGGDERHWFELFLAESESSAPPITVDEIGDRVLMAWAGTAPYDGPTDVLDEQGDFQVTALTRVFLEMGRSPNGRLKPRVGMLGWKASAFLGLRAPERGGDTPEPDATVTYGASAPATGTNGSGVQSTHALLSLNGVLRHVHREADQRHQIDLYMDDQVVALKVTGDEDKGWGLVVDVEETRNRQDASGSVPVVARHLIDLNKRDRKIDLQFFALQVLVLGERGFDLSGVFALESASRDVARAVARNQRRDVFALARTSAKYFARAYEKKERALVHVSRHSRDSTAPVPAGPVTGADERLPSRILDWDTHDAWLQQRAIQPSPVSAAPARADTLESSFRIDPRGFSVDSGVGLASTLFASVDDTRQPAWVPCTVLDGLSPNAVQDRTAKVWILGRQGGLQVLEDLGTATDPVRAAVALLADVGWTREAVLETWENEEVSWRIVDSPLLNRSLPLDWFTGAIPSPRAPTVAKAGRGTPLASEILDAAGKAQPRLDDLTQRLIVAPDESFDQSLPASAIRLAGTLRAGVVEATEVESLWSGGLSIGREIPFAWDLHAGSDAPFGHHAWTREIKVGSRSVVGRRRMKGWGVGADQARLGDRISDDGKSRWRAMPSVGVDMLLHAPRPGERTRYLLQAWAAFASPDDKSKVRQRIGRGAEFSVRTPRVAHGAELISGRAQWEGAPARPGSLRALSIAWSRELAHPLYELRESEPLLLMVHDPESPKIPHGSTFRAWLHIHLAGLQLALEKLPGTSDQADLFLELTMEAKDGAEPLPQPAVFAIHAPMAAAGTLPVENARISLGKLPAKPGPLDEAPVRTVAIEIGLPRLNEDKGGHAVLSWALTAGREGHPPQKLEPPKSNLTSLQMEPVDRDPPLGAMLGILGCRRWSHGAPEDEELLAYGPAGRGGWSTNASRVSDASDLWLVRWVKRGVFRLHLHEGRAADFEAYMAFSLDRAGSYSSGRLEGPSAPDPGPTA